MNIRAQIAPLGVAGVLAELARSMIHGLGWSVLVATTAPSGSALAAFAGGVLGCLVGARLGRSQLRTPVLLAGAVVGILMVAWVHSMVLGGIVSDRCSKPFYRLKNVADDMPVVAVIDRLSVSSA